MTNVRKWILLIPPVSCVLLLYANDLMLRQSLTKATSVQFVVLCGMGRNTALGTKIMMIVDVYLILLLEISRSKVPPCFRRFIKKQAEHHRTLKYFYHFSFPI